MGSKAMDFQFMRLVFRASSVAQLRFLKTYCHFGYPELVCPFNDLQRHSNGCAIFSNSYPR